MKIIYLDQFVLQRAFCPSPRDKHREFFVQVGELCLKLAAKRVASFPFSESHLRETSLQVDPIRRKNITEAFVAISNGYQFCPAQGVRELQAFSVRKGLPVDWSAHRVVSHDSRLGFCEKLSITMIPDRTLHHSMFKQVLLQFQNAADAKLDGIAKREAQAYGELLTRDLAARMVTGTTPDPLSLVASPHFRLFMELEMEMRADGVIDSLMEAYRFVCDRVMEVPCIRLETKLWEHFVKARRKALADENDPASTVEDIRFVSCFVPYCDAAFLEVKMTSWLRQSKLWDGHETELFSLKHRKDEFIQYLSGLEKDHATPVSPKTFPAFEAERLPVLRHRGQPLLWICFIPTHPDSLVRSKTSVCRMRPTHCLSVVSCPAEALSGSKRSLLRPAFQVTSWSCISAGRSTELWPFQERDATFRCGSTTVWQTVRECRSKAPSASRSRRIRNDLLRLGVSDWYMDSRDLLWPKPIEILATLFQPKFPKLGTKGRRVSAGPSGFG